MAGVSRGWFEGWHQGVSQAVGHTRACPFLFGCPFGCDGLVRQWLFRAGALLLCFGLPDWFRIVPRRMSGVLLFLLVVYERLMLLYLPL